MAEMGQMTSRFPWRMAGIFLLGLYVLAGGVYSLVLKPETHFSDEREYLALGTHLVQGPGYSLDGVHLTASRPPGYPFFIAMIKAAGGDILAIRLVQFLLVGGTLLLLVRLVPGGGEARLLMVTGLAMIYPVIFYLSGTLYAQTFAGFLFVLALVLMLIVKRSLLLDLATGLVFGELILAVPTFALTLIVVLAVAWILKLIRWNNGLLILVGASVLIGIWTVRNMAQFHQLVPLASNSGANLLIGNCENTTPSGGSGNVDRTRYRQEAEEKFAGQPPEQFEFSADRFYREAAITWIRNNPGRAFVLYLEKTANYFSVYNQYAPESQGEVSAWKQMAMGCSYVVLLALLAWRLCEMKRFPLDRREIFFLLVYVLSAFTMALFFTRIRFRIPFDYLIIAIIAGHLARRLDLWRGATKSI